MADLTITAANVKKGAGAVVVTGIAGATVTAGQSVYEDTGDANKWKLSDANGGEAILKLVKGVALCNASNDQPLTIQTGGDIAIGATVAVGKVYVLSETPGGICPVADLITGDRLAIVGYGKTTSTITLDINNAGIDLP